MKQVLMKQVSMVTDRKEELSNQAARQIAEQIQRKPNSNLGLPSGRTPVLMYKHLVELSKELSLDWSKVHCFALDDYIDSDEAHSFQTFLTDNLYKHVAAPQANLHNPTMVENYDKQIEEHGGLDLTILGIGGNGHIAFNEPPKPELCYTHCTFLEDRSRQALTASFGSLERTPTRAVTMGVSTILASKAIILLAFGPEKKAIVHKAFSDGVNPNVPASYLTTHGSVNVLTDCE